MQYAVDIGKTIHNLRECEAQPPVSARLSGGARYLVQNVLIPFSENAEIRAENLDFNRFDEDDVEELTDYADECCNGYSKITEYARRLSAQPCAVCRQIGYFY